MKRLIVALSVLMASSLASFGTVTLSFNAPFTGGVSSNLANAAGVVTNGMSWGVIVDANGDGFASSYDSVSFSSGQHALTIGGVSSDDVLIISTDLTQSTALFTEGDFITPGGNGGVTSITNLSVVSNGNVNAGDTFRLVWIDPGGASAGSLSNASFVLPSDGASSDAFAQAFVGSDPVRPATGITFVAVPEPSAALLGGLGALALLRRRRVA